ncbi:MAG TPA: ribosomal protein S18-alanine N-acetyltransferase [Armatimonadota bacterium]|nr:ribosomal protein S18-alanine N-acetyltransferase [Armatimonadota bacterium]HQK93529.1 ribosomal protein S18-alanine N-acetyltransferase [Armatimonadota bacterium]
MTPEPIAIGPLTPAQLDDACEVERLCFATPWGREALEAELGRSSMCCYVSATLPSGRTVGYAGMWVVGDEAHIGTLGVHPDYRRSGIGERLLVNLLLRAARRGVGRVTLEVRASNVAAMSLYGKYRFRALGVRRGYYRDNGEDAVLMALEELDTERYQAFIADRADALDCAPGGEDS